MKPIVLNDELLLVVSRNQLAGKYQITFTKTHNLPKKPLLMNSADK